MGGDGGEIELMGSNEAFMFLNLFNGRTGESQ